MAQTPQQFFEKNMKWIALALLILLALTKMQSCNRNVTLSLERKQYTYTIDSLTNKYSILEKETSKTISELQKELELSNQFAKLTNEKATAVQSVAEKLKSNTTVNIRGAQLDTIKIKK